MIAVTASVDDQEWLVESGTGATACRFQPFLSGRI